MDMRPPLYLRQEPGYIKVIDGHLAKLSAQLDAARESYNFDAITKVWAEINRRLDDRIALIRGR